MLQALFNGSKQQGMGFMDRSGAVPITLEDAERYCQHDNLYFDYLRGRVLKVDLSGDTFSSRLYDRDNGPGAAEEVIQQLRQALSNTQATA